MRENYVVPEYGFSNPFTLSQIMKPKNNVVQTEPMNIDIYGNSLKTQFSEESGK